MRIVSFIRTIRSHVPERLDPSEPDVRITYRYVDGCPSTATSPADPAEVDLLQIVRVRDHAEVLAAFAGERECMDQWTLECYEHAREHVAYLSGKDDER